MPMASVRLIPGVDVEKSQTLNEAGYSKSAFIRWKEGLAQKLGGWVRYYQFAVSGVPRDLRAWEDLNATQHLAVATTTALDVITSGALTNITPQTLTSDFAPVFDTTSSQATVNITDANLTGALASFDSIYFNTPISVGGLILSGLYQVTQNLSTGPTKYQITASSNATGSVTGGGAVPQFTTTNGSATVTVTLANHGLSAGGTINFPIATTGNGVTIGPGTYPAISITNANAFTIIANTTANAGSSFNMNSSNAEIVYYITLGPSASGTGYGIGTYGTGGYGTGTSTTNQTGTAITATDYTQDNWGSYLLSCPSGGAIYNWQPSSGYGNAQIIANAPPFNGGIFVAMPAQILVAWGSTSSQNIGVNQDPLFIKWSDQLNFNTWIAATTNQAGSFRIPTGSMIVGGMQGPQSAYIWTDIDLYAMNYIGYPLVFGFNKIGSSCGLISSHGAAQLGGTIFWMGPSNFFALTGGGATPLPCPVWDQVFQNINTTYLSKVRCEPNTDFNEVWWFYPSAASTGENDSYVKLTVTEGSWDYGPLARSAAIDRSVLGSPIMATPTGLIYQHEQGQDADGQPIAASFTTGYWRISEGNEYAFIDQIIPDMRFSTTSGTINANMQVTFYSQNYPGDTPITYGPYNFTNTTQFITTRIRGRQIAMQISSNDVGSFWRLGKLSYRFAIDGRH